MNVLQYSGDSIVGEQVRVSEVTRKIGLGSVASHLSDFVGGCLSLRRGGRKARSQRMARIQRGIISCCRDTGLDDIAHSPTTEISVFVGVDEDRPFPALDQFQPLLQGSRRAMPGSTERDRNSASCAS